MSAKRQVTVTLESDLDAFVRSEAERCDFSSDSDYIAELVRERYDLEQLLRGPVLQQALQEGAEDAGHDRIVQLDEAFDRLREELGLTKVERDYGLISSGNS